MRAITLQLGKSELHSARLFKAAVERDPRPHDSVKPAPAKYRNKSEYADGDQQFDQGQALVPGRVCEAVIVHW